MITPALKQTLKRKAPMWRSRVTSSSLFVKHSATLAAVAVPSHSPALNPLIFPQTNRVASVPAPERDGRSDLKQTLNILNSEVESFVHDPLSVLDWTMDRFNGNVAMSTSFGIQSSVLLHLATQVKPDIPIVWVDTGYLPKETYEYAEQLKETLNLNLIVKTNEEWSPARMEAVYGKLWESEDPKAHALYGRMRKVEPLQDGLNSIEPNPLALLSGLRASQTKARANMSPVGFQNSRYKVLPMLKMTDEDVLEYMDRYDLPQHPLTSQGYVTVGDWHSSRPVQEGEDARETRFGGKFQECGLHVDESEHTKAETAQSSSVTQSSLKSFASTGVEALEEVKANPETDIAVILVKKIMEDGSFCRKCNDVAGKIESDNVGKWIGYTGYADLRDAESEGIKLAKHFDVSTAPFFLVRTTTEEAENKEWRVVKSYLQLRKMLEKAAKNKSS